MCPLWRPIREKVCPRPLQVLSRRADVVTTLVRHSSSDLLSRHVNKCHTNEKKSGGAGGRVRKHRQPLNPAPAPPTLDPTLANSPPQPILQHQRQPHFTHSTTSDPFRPALQLYPPHDAYPPRSFDSSSHPPSASVSLDNLPSYTLPATAPNYTARAPNAYLPGNRQTPATRAHFEHSLASTQSVPNGHRIYKQPVNPDMFQIAEHDDSGIFPNPPAETGFTDLSATAAYPYKYRAGSDGSSDGHSTSSNPAYGYGHGYRSEGHAAGLNMPYVPQPNLEAPSAPDGGFSSSFGLMSLEDPAILAGVSSGVPFFDTGVTTQQHPDLHGLLPPPPNQPFDWNGSGFGVGPVPANVTPGTREREANQLREFWSAFLRDPTARLNPDGTEVQRPDFPTPSIHRRSSSYSGPSNNNGNNNINDGYQQQSTSSTKPPHMPGPQQTLVGGADIVAQLEAQAARDQQQRTQQQQPKAPQLVAHVASHASPEALKSYEEAVLARKAPVLKLPSKLKMRDAANTTGGSSVLPSISQINRSIPGNSGGVASLASGAQLPTLAAASSVPPGSTPNQGLAALQQHGQSRLVLPLPRPRSRPSTSTGHYPSDQSPTSLTHSAPATPIHMYSVPSSRPGTSAGQYPQAQVDPQPGTSTSGGLNTGASNDSRPSTAGSNASNSNWQPGYAVHPGSGQMLPPLHIPNSEKQLADYHAAMSAALNISSNAGASPASSARPSYKRLASQILESAAIKRARDDLNNTSAIEDDDDDEEHHPQRQREGSTESNEPGSSAAVSSMGSHSGHSNSFGQDGSSFAEHRRMSEPGSGARAYPRPGNLVVAHSNTTSGPGLSQAPQVSHPGSVAAPVVRPIPVQRA